MKLTRRVLAVIIAAAMLVGAMSIGAFAAIGNYDAETNPYEAKIGLKAYRVDTETGEYTEITDGKVLNGEVIRIEVWGQTNYYASIANFIMAYSNNIFAPTKLDYSTYEYGATPGAGLGMEVMEPVAYDEDAVAAAQEAEAMSFDTYGDFVVSYDAPYPYTAAAKMGTTFAGGEIASAINSYYPRAWRNADGSLNATGAQYNVLSVGFGPDAELAMPASINTGLNTAVVLHEYQPIVYFNLTVNAESGKGEVKLPAEALKTSTNNDRMYFSVGTPNADYFGMGVEEAQACTFYALNFSQNKVIYEDGTVADNVVNLDDATIDFTVVSSLEGGDEPDPEPEDPTLVPLGDTIIDEDRGFIYGLPHADLGGVADLVEEGYVELEGEGEVVCTTVDGNDLLGTGATVEVLNSNGDVVAEYTVIIFGDSNGDATISPDDTADAELWYAYLESEIEDYEDMTDPRVFALDITADEAIGTDDFEIVDFYYAYIYDDVPQTYEGF